MRKRFLFIFFIALLTACGIIIFQLYWVYNTYKAGESNLNKTLTGALEKSIESYELQENQLPASLKYKAPSLSVFMRTHPDKHLPDSIRSALKNAKETFTVEYKNMLITSDELPMVKIMLARLLAQQLGKPINMNLLAKIYSGELTKLNIDLPFRLILLQGHTTVQPSHIGAYLSFLKSPTVIEAVFDNVDRLLITRNILPAAVSFLLILLSAGSLFYMGYIIRRQIQLDDMKNDFINNVTHELRTPISILKTSNEALTSFGAAEDPERSARYLRINHMVLEKLDANVERILDIIQYEQGVKPAKYESIDLKEVINATLRMFAVNEHAEISYLYEADNGLVYTDSYMIGAIVSNLVENAIKYGRESVTVEIKVVDTNTGWQLAVKDNGRGIDESRLPFIFDKFYRVQEGDLYEVKGYGLGLSYVKQLVSTLKGEITVDSKKGVGTTFKINFPVCNG
jgi:two-component system phosphate regulon sensor histidine kinase PhoR